MWLATLNTSLIVVSGVFLGIGYFLIRTKNVYWHKRAMLTATLFAALFLVVYVSRLALFNNKLFPGGGWLQTIYFAILVPHVILAIAIGPMVLVTLRRALTGRFDKHRQIARITVPIWAFVAVSGWVVYLMLYHL